jgi:hypothetical protein
VPLPTGGKDHPAYVAATFRIRSCGGPSRRADWLSCFGPLYTETAAATCPRWWAAIHLTLRRGRVPDQRNARG